MDQQLNLRNLFKIGFIVNPICGMGGSVGLKGTDGIYILKKAIELGATPKAEERAKIFLNELLPIKNKLLFITAPNVMGGIILEQFDFNYKILDENIFPNKIELFFTTPEHTKISVKKFLEEKCDIICFVGGDGTARDILEIIDQNIPCLGIPAGVKMHSGVFALNPKLAAHLLMKFLWNEASLRESEVMDIDEESFRNNILSAKLYGFMLTPYILEFSQASKTAITIEDEQFNKERIAKWIIENMEENVIYIIGPGTTTKAIADLLNQQKTLLGVDIMINKKMIKLDLNEQELLNSINNKESKIIITPIGNQGFIFGRGNLQISPKVIKSVGIKNIIIICTKYKLKTLQEQKLCVDTGDPELDDEMKGYYKVIEDYGDYKILEVK